MSAHAHGFHCHPARYIGRVGALAVALGVGGAILGFAGVAAADGDAPDTAGGGASSAGSRPTGDGRAAADRPGDRRSAPTGQSGAAAATSRGDGAGDRVATPERGPRDPRATAEGQTSRGRDAVSLPAETPDIRSFDIGSRVLPALPTTVTANGPAALSGGQAPPTASPTPPISMVALTPEASATAAAAPDVAVAGDALALLGGGDDAPLLAPLAWATLAAARRDELAGAAPQVAPAATVAAADTVDPTLEVGKPTPMTFSGVTAPNGSTVGKNVIITGSNFKVNKQTGVTLNVNSVKFGCDSNSGDCQEGIEGTIVELLDSQITVTIPDYAQSGYIRVGKDQFGSTVSPVFSSLPFTVENAVQFVPLPGLPPCTTGNCSLLVQKIPATGFNARLTVINQLSNAVAAAFQPTSPSLPCRVNGCPVPPGQTTLSIANTIGMYGFNLVYLLSGADGSPKQPTDFEIGQQLTTLVTQPNLLQFIASTVAGSPALPPAVATAVGGAVSTFVDQAFSNPTVATALVPFLKTLGVPATTEAGAALAKTLTGGGSVTQFLLTQFDANLKAGTPQQALLGFFGAQNVQEDLGGAFTDAVETLLTPTVAGYLGQVAAAAVLGPDNPATPGLAATIGNAVEGLFASVGSVVATDAGNAFATFLAQPELDGQPAVGETLATVVINQVLAGLGGTPQPVALLPALAPAADVAVTQFVTSVLSNTEVDQALGTFVGQLTPAVLADPGVQQLVSQDVSAAVSGLLGGGSFGQVVGDRVGAAAAALLADPTLSGALAQLATSVVEGVLGAPGVVTDLADVAGGLASAVLGGTPLNTALSQAVAALQASGIGAAVGPVVTAAVAEFLGTTGLGPAVDTAISALVTGLIADPAVQQSLADRVANEVNSLLGFGPISVVGEKVGDAVVTLLTNPTISAAIVDLVDTVVGDFIAAPGVITALSEAAGELATAAVEGDLDTVSVAVGKALRANPDIDAAVQSSVGAAVAQLLGDTQVWATVDSGVTALLTDLITDPVVQSALTDRIADEVSTQLGGGDLGEVVGGQVAATVVGLLTDPVIGGALLGVVDTVFSDLFSSTGVVDAFATAAGDLALAALTLTGSDFDEARAGIIFGLRENPDVDAGVQASVEDAVADFLNNAFVWSSVDSAAATLVGELLGDTVVQQALTDRIANEVNTRLGFGPISVVGDQIGAFVVGLLTDPIVSEALVDIVDTVVTDFIYSDGVVDALSGAAGDIALAVLTGESFSAAVQDALSALEANSSIQTAVQTTIDDALGVINTEVLSNATFQQDLGNDVTTLINELAADPAVQTLVTDRFGPGIGGLLTDTAVVGDVATAVGSAVTGLLGYAGVSTALTDAADQFINAVLDGTDAGKAGQEALKTLQADPAFVAAVNSVIPPIIDGLLDTAEVRQAIALAAQETVVARLEESWFNIPFLDRLIGKVTYGTVADFLTRRAGQELVDKLAVGTLLGEQVSVVDELLRTPTAQIALGFSIGAGIGSLFGDNIIGEIIGWVAGFPATVVVGLSAAVIGLYQWIVEGWMFLMDSLIAPAQSVEIRYPTETGTDPVRIA